MLIGLRAIGSAFKQVLTHVTGSVLSNLVAAALSAPIVIVVGAVAFGTHSYSLIPLGVALLVGILPNPAAAGLHAVSQEFSTAGYATIGEHWSGLRHYFLPALKAWLASLLVTALILANIIFYIRQMGGTSGAWQSIAPGLILAWVAILIVWLAMHLYIYPLLVVQEVKSLRLTYRNAFMMTLARPAVTSCVFPIWIALLLLSSSTGLVSFIGLALCSAIQHTTANRLLPTFRLQATS